MTVKVDLEKCTGCGSCSEACPWEAIEIENAKAKIDEDERADCGACLYECETEALSLD